MKQTDGSESEQRYCDDLMVVCDMNSPSPPGVRHVEMRAPMMRYRIDAETDGRSL